ncbi:hypothetical protein R3P38DRAFT_3271252 [Favolaschia claudopus]|uniref:Uncharacterized protein n=1 Tax=Favolaschia claudopus TaxID=2862362 RepID=A0AAW0BAI6_9AGAR
MALASSSSKYPVECAQTPSLSKLCPATRLPPPPASRPSASSASSTNILRKRGYPLIERASRSFTTAESNARSGGSDNDNDNDREESQSLPSPVTCHIVRGDLVLYGAEGAEGDEDKKAAPAALDDDGI